MENRLVTLDEFIWRNQKEIASATGEFSGLLRDIGVAAKIINREVNKAGLVDIIGLAGGANTTGDDVQKLDIFANNMMIDFLKNSGECCAIASEELEDFVTVPGTENKKAKYVVVMDPLDGSSNIDVNVSVGTIFGVYKRISKSSEEPNLGDFLQKGTELVASGYILYGSSTMLVYTSGDGLNGFTLDPSLGEFCLSHENIKMPDSGPYYSVNQGYYHVFSKNIQNYIDSCSRNKLGLRYIGSLVSDIHRNLFKGGIFFYPETKKHPNGKLRVLYECNPMAMIVEQAGGTAVDCKGNRILEIQPTELHMRSSGAMGSKDMVEDMMTFIANG